MDIVDRLRDYKNHIVEHMIAGVNPMILGLVSEAADEIERLRTAVKVEREECAQEAEEKAKEFLSPEYATGQPLSSFSERFACVEVAKAIRSRG